MIDKRINFRGGGAYQGGSGAPGSAESSGNKSNSNSNSSNNNDGPQHSPHTKSGYTGPTNYGPQQPPQEIIGDKSFNVTPDTRDKREEASQEAQTEARIQSAMERELLKQRGK